VNRTIYDIDVIAQTRWGLLGLWWETQPKRFRWALVKIAVVVIALLGLCPGAVYLVLDARVRNFVGLAVIGLAAGALKLLLDPPGRELAGILAQVRSYSYGVEQGRVSLGEIEERLAITDGIPLAMSGECHLGLALGAEGHVLVVGPTGAGKGLHLSDVLWHWPEAAVIIDPKGEQHERFAGLRSRMGPVYRIPGDTLDLAHYYDLTDFDDVTELHLHLVRPWLDREPIFAEKSRALFAAVGRHARARGRHPIRSLIGATQMPLLALLERLDQTVPRLMRQFTNGLEPGLAVQDRFVTSVWGTLTSRMFDFVKHVDTVAPAGGATIPLDWAEQRSTIFVTYSLTDLDAVGPLVAAIVAALMRYKIRTASRTRTLFAIDELRHVGLHNLANYLATMRAFGSTLLLYAQALSQLESVYGAQEAQTIITNCAHQVWYAPNDPRTAQQISLVYGRKLHTSLSTDLNPYMDKASGSVSRLRYMEGFQAGIDIAELLSLPADRVVVLARADRQYRFIAQRCDPRGRFGELPKMAARRPRAAAAMSAGSSPLGPPPGPTETSAAASVPAAGVSAPATGAPNATKRRASSRRAVTLSASTPAKPEPKTGQPKAALPSEARSAGSDQPTPATPAAASPKQGKQTSRRRTSAV
jgi:hypothetical protein